MQNRALHVALHNFHNYVRGHWQISMSEKKDVCDEKEKAFENLVKNTFAKNVSMIYFWKTFVLFSKWNFYMVLQNNMLSI